jgi:hypothetical protein
VFAPMMAPPKIVWRDLVLIAAGITAGLADAGNATRICGSERPAHTTGFVNVQSVFDHHKSGRHHRAFSVMNRYVGNLPPMPGVFPDYQAPVIRNAGTERELITMRWGMPPPPRAGGFR